MGDAALEMGSLFTWQGPGAGGGDETPEKQRSRTQPPNQEGGNMCIQ